MKLWINFFILSNEKYSVDIKFKSIFANFTNIGFHLFRD